MMNDAAVRRFGTNRVDERLVDLEVVKFEILEKPNVGAEVPKSSTATLMPSCERVVCTG